MANEMTEGPNGTMMFQRGEKIFVIGPDGKPRGVREHTLPALEYMPWALVW
jgi:hypothetical protein